MQKCTRAPSLSAARRRAKETAKELINGLGLGSQWKPKSKLADYVEQVSLPAMEAAPLRENSRKRYRRTLSLIAGVSKAADHTIASGTRFRALEACLTEIADKHGSETARQCRTVLGRYVIQQLIRDEVITANPLAGMSVDLRSAKVPTATGPKGGIALSRADWNRVIDHLLAADPADVVSMRQGRWPLAVRLAKAQTAIDLTLAQAATGLRISEWLALTWHQHITVNDDGQMLVYVPAEVSKTGKARTVPVLHADVQTRLLSRQNASRGLGYVFGSPADASTPWERANAQKATTFLYLRMHAQLGIAAFETERSHVWRATLNSLLLDQPEVMRAAFFGHDVSINRTAYTDLTDVSGMVAAAGRLRAV